MPKIAFLFPGQGSQYPGMGRELAEKYSCARRVFDEADRALGLPLSKLCFEGPADELQKTAITQPAVLTVSVAAAEVLRAMGVRADYVAGHSLGEYAALAATGAMCFVDAVRLVHKRGRYMQEAVPLGEGAMAALLGMALPAVREVCRDAAQGDVVSPANLNAPGQVVIAGHARAVARAIELARARGARHAINLAVSAPFHCALMKPAADLLARDLDGMEIRDPGIPLVNNVDAQLVYTASAVQEGLKRQVTAPVQWERSMRALVAEGAQVFVEVGPGKVLSGLMRQIDRAAECGHVDDEASVNGLLERLGHRVGS